MTGSERSALQVAQESDLPYQGLRGLRPDPNLLLYLPAALARTGAVAPLGLKDNVLQLACTTPNPDLGALRDRFPRLALDLCVSPAEDIRDLLAGMRERTL
jgi:hypothetical protein